MNDWLDYIKVGFLALPAIVAIVWWLYLIIRAWKAQSRIRAILLLVIPAATLASSFWIDDSLFVVVLLFGILASYIHLVATCWRRSKRVLAVVATLFLLTVPSGLWMTNVEKYGGGHFPSLPPNIPDLIKEDCQKLVAGQLVFTPNATMRQGNPYIVSARLSRGTGVHITEGLDGKGIIIENALVSCMVSMNLDSQEPDAFKIENMPAGRKDEQILLANAFTQWDWRVTPVKSGTLHLLLYVTPMIYVDQVGQGLKRFRQPARVITVSPDYVFAVKNFVLGNWAVWGSILTAIIIPAFIWMLRKINKRREEKRETDLAAKKGIGFGGN